MSSVHLTWPCVCTSDGLREGFPSAKNMIAHLMWASSQAPWLGGVTALRCSAPLRSGAQHRWSAKVSVLELLLHKLASSELFLLHALELQPKRRDRKVNASLHGQ